ncbi:MAG: trypsin-like peptidase domain-containing protein [Chloroflexota bacterium]
MRSALPFASGVLAALVALLLYNALTPQPHQITQREVNDSISQAMASATPRPPFSSTAFSAILPSLVTVELKPPGSNSNAFYDDGDDFALDDNDGSLHFLQANGVGSGVIVNTDGDILTALHLVSGDGTIEVTFADGMKSTASISGTQAENDIAVLHPDKLPGVFIPATLGNPNALRIGDEAYVVGNPFGLTDSMSAGVISGLDRTYMVNGDLTLQHLIQFDAAVNAGNSGGPLINRQGQVVGIVAVLLNPTGQNVFIGVGFAVTITAAAGGAGLPPS